VRNKANSWMGRNEVKYCYGGWLQEFGPPHWSCKTKPIWPDRGSASTGKRCETNPICLAVKVEEVGRGRPTYQEAMESRGNRAKQSHKAVVGSRLEYRLCETKPKGRGRQPVVDVREEEVGRGRPTYQEAMTVARRSCGTKPIDRTESVRAKREIDGPGSIGRRRPGRRRAASYENRFEVRTAGW